MIPMVELCERVARSLDVVKIASSGHPLLSACVRVEDWFGSGRIVPVESRECHGCCERWVLDRVSCYEVATITGHQFAAGSINAWGECMGAIERVGKSISDSLYMRRAPVMAQFGVYDCDIDALNDWVPPHAPLPDDDWRGVNRSVDPVRLAGQSFSGSGMPACDTLADADALGMREGGLREAPFYMNPETYDRMHKSDRRSTLVQDESCPKEVVWRVPRGALDLLSLGAMPHLMDFDGNVALRRRTEDALDIRFGFYGNTCVRAPSQIVRISGLELRSTTSTSVPTPNATQTTAFFWPFPDPGKKEEAAKLPVVKVGTIVAQPPAPVDVTCKNKTCGKANDAGAKKCWNCAGPL